MYARNPAELAGRYDPAGELSPSCAEIAPSCAEIAPSCAALGSLPAAVAAAAAVVAVAVAAAPCGEGAHERAVPEYPGTGYSRTCAHEESMWACWPAQR